MLLVEDQAAVARAPRGLLYSANGHIDVVITDLVMHEMLGTELVDHLNRERALTNIIFMSGYCDVAREIAPEHQILKKPFVLAEL